MNAKSQLLERERRWGMIAGIASVAGVALILASFGESASAVRSASGLAENLAEIDADRSALVIASSVQFLGWLLLAVPLVYLFKAASGRTDQVRTAFIGVLIAAPLFLGIGGLLGAGSVLQAATDFKDVPASTIDACVDEKIADADGKPTDQEISDFNTDCADDEAEQVRGDASLSSIETGFGLAGLLGFTVSVVYVSLWSMRVGLLSRFWGSLGMALGAVFVFFTLFTLIWFIYLGLLFVGWVPGGRPPAWAAGEATPWPRPGDRGGDSDEDDDGGPGPAGGGPDQSGDEVIEGYAEEVDGEPRELGEGESGTGADPGEPLSAEQRSDPEIQRRKRKKRS
jgi:hypothetical protein